MKVTDEHVYDNKMLLPYLIVDEIEDKWRFSRSTFGYVVYYTNNLFKYLSVNQIFTCIKVRIRPLD